MSFACPKCGEEKHLAAKVLSYDIVSLDEDGELTSNVVDTQPTDQVVVYICETCGNQFGKEESDDS